jgi:hypothetical protein
MNKLGCDLQLYRKFLNVQPFGTFFVFNPSFSMTAAPQFYFLARSILQLTGTNATIFAWF